MEEIANVLLARTKKEIEMGVVGGKEEKSIIGLLSSYPFQIFRRIAHLSNSKNSQGREWRVRFSFD